MAKKTNLDRLEAIRDKLKKTDVGGGGGGFWSPKVGKSTIRILPGPDDPSSGYFFQTVGIHVFSPDGKKRVYCPSFTSEGELPCPVCELISELYKLGDKGSKKLASSIKLRKAYWMNVVDRADEDRGPQIFTPGVKVFGALCSIINDPDYGDITDLETGFDIVIDREGTGLDTEYQVRPKPRITPLSADDDLINEWLDKAKDLAYIELSDDPEEDVELSKDHAVYVLPYDRIVKDYDLEDISDEDIDDDDEEDEKPLRKVPAKTRKAVEETEDSDDNENAEEDEEPPAKKEVSRRLARRSLRRSR